MLFTSLEYLIFFPIVAFGYLLLPNRISWAFLLAASYFFYYFSKPEYIFLLAAITLITYICGILLDTKYLNRRRLPVLIFGLVFNIGILFAFKYFSFFASVAKSLFGPSSIMLPATFTNLILPVGISFYIFKALSYLIDNYRGTIRPEKNLGIFALYLSFFPALLAGPIDRANVLITQLKNKPEYCFDNVVAGVQMLVLGYFKKVVIADRLAAYVDPVFNNISGTSPIVCLLAIYFYSLQIYCDFSGYSDIAIGSARVMGIKLSTNFNLPYFAENLSDFWRRWHITLSNWFRDYVYIPLGGSRKGTTRTFINLVITMTLCGLWHGAAFTFIIWGFLHGALMACSRLIRKSLKKPAVRARQSRSLSKIIKILITFHVVSFLWVFFRADNINDSILFLSKVGQLAHVFSSNSISAFISSKDLMLVAVFVVLTFLLEYARSKWEVIKGYGINTVVLYSFFFWSIVIWGNVNTKEFIYFQF